MTKTWNLTITPEDDAPATVTGLSHAEMIQTVYALMQGETPEVRRTEPSTQDDARLAA